MRLGVFLCILAGLAGPAVAADSVADQAHSAFAVFAGGLSQQGFLSGQLGRAGFRNIEGKWARLGGPDPRTGIETYGVDSAKLCKTAAAQALRALDDLTLEVTTTAPGGAFTQVYSLIAGSTFGEHTDTTRYLSAIGLPVGNTNPATEQQRALALSLVNGLVQIYRPSDDILVMTRDRGYPIVFARCPAA